MSKQQFDHNSKMQKFVLHEPNTISEHSNVHAHVHCFEKYSYNILRVLGKVTVFLVHVQFCLFCMHNL